MTSAVRRWKGNHKQHKSRSTMRCPGITSCNNHKACQSSWENITKLIRIQKCSCPLTAHAVPLHAHRKPLWTQQCEAGCVNHRMQEEMPKISRSLAPNHLLWWGQRTLRRKRFLPSKGGKSSKTDLDYLTQVGSGFSSLCLYIAAVLACAYRRQTTDSQN